MTTEETNKEIKDIPLKNFSIGRGHPLTLISGPCVIESLDLALSTAKTLKDLCEEKGISFIYKSSYDKANRSSLDSYRGPGIEEGLSILAKVKREYGVPVLSDVHTPEEARKAAEVCDVIQIPAFLCRQTDLLVAAGETGAVVNIKKGQFLSPWDMENVVEKVLSTGNSRILLTDRGTTFGYQNLVSDMRSIPIMNSFGFPVCFDASHSVQLPGGRGKSSGGQREFIPTLAKAAIAAGSSVIFLESHPNPSRAKSDKDSVFPLPSLPSLLDSLLKVYKAVS